MKKSIFSIFLLIAISAFSVVFGQTTPVTPGAPAGAGTPSGGGDRNLAESLRKANSIEMERMKREAERPTETNSAVHTKAQSKFPQIKEDFEGIQIAESAIIKTYTTDKKIDYALVEISAEDIIKRTKRLDSNIFAEPITKKEDDDKSKENTDKPKNLKELIVELNNAIGNFVSSPIFGNLKVVDPKVAVKTREDLFLVQELSAKISAEAKKLK